LLKNKRKWKKKQPNVLKKKESLKKKENTPKTGDYSSVIKTCAYHVQAPGFNPKNQKKKKKKCLSFRI
jgi:hypothetical protein